MGMDTCYSGHMTTETVCSVDDCDRPSRARGMCSMHYQRSRIGAVCKAGGCGDPVAYKSRYCETHRSVCQEAECANIPYSMGYCSSHYRARKDRGDFGTPPCVEPECEKVGSGGLAYCMKHYRQHRRDGKFGAAECLVDGCSRAGVQRKMCSTHDFQERTYGLSLLQMAKFLALNECESCGLEPPTVVDHCHSTNVVRGYICRPCNSMLGYAKDNVYRLNAGVRYLTARGAGGHD
jgi:hypothetical protein